MIQRLPCKSCSDLIHPDTAAKNDGLCMPCKGGFRASIEAAKMRREEERIYERSPERQLWLALTERVYGTPNGFDQLNTSEKTYFAVTSLIGEVYNGGFDQFFWNSSGSLYAHALDGLLEMQADHAAALLVSSKQVVFGDDPIPVDDAARRAIVQRFASDGELKALDKAFCADEEGLDERLRHFAAAHRLY